MSRTTPREDLGVGWEPTPDEIAVTRSAVERARQARVLQAQAAAMEAQALAEAGEVARAQLARSGATSSRYDFPFRAMAGEFAAALGESKGRMQTRMGDAMVLVASFPETFAALEGARITGRHADVIRLVGMRLPDGLREVFEAAAVGYAETATPFETREFAESLAERLDPRSFTERHKSAMARRGLWVKVLPDGTQALEIIGEATRIQAVARTIRQHARAIARQERQDAEAAAAGADSSSSAGAGAGSSSGAGSGAVGGGLGVRFEDSDRVGSGDGPRTAAQVAADVALEALSVLCGGPDPDDETAPWTTPTHDHANTDAAVADADVEGAADTDDADSDGAAAATAVAQTDLAANDTSPADGSEGPATGMVATDPGPRDATGATPGAAPPGGRPPGTAPPSTSPPAPAPPGTAPPGAAPAPAPVPESASVRALSGDLDRVLAGVWAVVQVTVAATTLAGLDDEPGFLAGYGPIDPDTARRLAAHAPGWERVFRHPDTGALLTVDRYTPTAAQKRYLLARDERCRTPGCRNLAITADLDHTIPYAQGGATDVENLACLCEGCHRDKHHTPWRVRQLGGGVLEWTSPAGYTYTEKPAPQTRAEAIPGQAVDDALTQHHRARAEAEQRRRTRQREREHEQRRREQEQRERERRLHLEMEEATREWLSHYWNSPEYIAQAIRDAEDLEHREPQDHGPHTLEPA